MGEPISDAPTPGAPTNKKNSLGIATLVVAVLILIAVSGILGLDIWQTKQPDASGLAGEVQRSMNIYFAEEDTLRDATAGSVIMMRVGENSFEGQADVSTNSGKHRSVPVHVKYDGQDMFWNTDPGAFLFVTAP